VELTFNVALSNAGPRNRQGPRDRQMKSDLGHPLLVSPG
jgi:hypothetical protein